MRAVILERYGGPDVLRVAERPDPEPGPGEVVIDVRAAGVGFSDLLFRMGLRKLDELPAVLGYEVAGTVAARGADVSGPELGSRVAAFVPHGGYAERVLARAGDVLALPDRLSFEQGAAVPLSFATAYAALVRFGGCRPGERVLIHGAAGGVGTFAVQLAHAAGAQVIATGRAPDHMLLAKLGAEKVVDVERQRFEEVAGRIDLALDLVGGEVAGRSWPLVKPGGALVTVVGGTAVGQPRQDARWVFFVVEADRAQLAELGRRVDAGELQPVVGRVWPLAEGRQAFQAKQHGGLPGKVVLRVADQR